MNVRLIIQTNKLAVERENYNDFCILILQLHFSTLKTIENYNKLFNAKETLMN